MSASRASLEELIGRAKNPLNFLLLISGGSLLFPRRHAGRRGHRCDGGAERLPCLRPGASLEQRGREAARDGADDRDRPAAAPGSAAGEQALEIPIEELVPGDVVRLSAGDMIPADLRVLTAKDLFLNEASLTGEAMPVEKSAAPVHGHERRADRLAEYLLHGQQCAERRRPPLSSFRPAPGPISASSPGC